MDDAKSNYIKQLEGLGFYADRRRVDGMLHGEVLRSARSQASDAEHIDRSFKYSAVLDRNKLGVTDIYELDDSPCIYFKSIGSEPSPDQMAAWHKAAWNHGLGRMLWICTPTEIRVFNAFAPPPKGADALDSTEPLLFKGIASRLDALKAERLTREHIESGEFWFGALGKKIDRKNRVDEQLVTDLSDAAVELGARGLPGVDAHRLLLRTIFIAYLEAKGILPKELFDGLNAQTFEEVLSSVAKTKKFFARMAETFNGDLFPPPPRDASPVEQLTQNQLKLAQCILTGTEVASGQKSFSFCRYDFSIIPIEVISSIYERFVHAAKPDEAIQAGTHYTPVNLVDFVLSQVFDDGLFDEELPTKAKVVDLACGSGVFLVESLRRLIARRLAAGEKFTRDLVREVLYDQVYGVDIEESAIQIAAFSLCLTAFELDPTPNSRHQLKFKHPLNGRNLFVADAFDLMAEFNRAGPFRDKSFDIVVGNPPWTRPKGKRSRSPSGKPRYIEYCEAKEPEPIPLPFRDPPDQAFVWRVRDFARTSARIGMVLDGKRFFSQENESLAAKRELFQSFEPSLVVNFAGLHDQRLFPATKQPAVVFVATNHRASERSAFRFVAVEFSRTFRKHGILQIGAEHVHRLSVSVAASDPYALKIATWGSARDRALVDRLVKAHDSVEVLLAKHGIEMHQGYIEGNRERRVPDELRKLRCLTGGGMPAFEFTAEGLHLPFFAEEFLQWPRSPDIYRGPLLLCRSALEGNRIVAAYCKNDVVFSLSQFGTSFKDGPVSLAFYLNAVLNSSLATYLTFLTATKWGLEKYEILSNDILRLPVPDPAAVEAGLMKSILEVERSLRQAALAGRYDRERVAQLDELVFDLYDLERFERVIVEDMVDTTIDFQRRHEESDAMHPASLEHRRAYAEHLMAVIQPFFETLKQRRMVAEILDVGGPLRVARFEIVPWSNHSHATVAVRQAREFDEVLREIAASLDEPLSFDVRSRRYLRVYAGDAFYVIKPSQRRFWTRSAGLVDGDAVMKDLLEQGAK
ncbi:MAG TPA: N-6 DNA methylase [Pirellulales bacterium]|jgi:hypothetical protein|nr:N-6 DNA methylase [Pirellulales bacterium]